MKQRSQILAILIISAASFSLAVGCGRHSQKQKSEGASIQEYAFLEQALESWKLEPDSWSIRALRWAVRKYLDFDKIRCESEHACIPQMAYLFVESKIDTPADTPDSVCSAVLVAPQILLTSGHCIERNDASVQVYFPSSREFKAENRTVSEVLMRSAPPRNGMRNLESPPDFAYLKLDKPVKRTPLRRALVSPSPGEIVTAYGIERASEVSRALEAKEFNATYVFGKGDRMILLLGLRQLIKGNSGGALLNSAGELVGSLRSMSRGEDFSIAQSIVCIPDFDGVTLEVPAECRVRYRFERL